MMKFVADRGTCYDIQLKKLVSDGAVELSFATNYKQTVLQIAISSSVAKNSNSYMPSEVSFDNCVLVHSNIHVNQLADSIAVCISKETDAYSMLVDAVWSNMQHSK